MNDRQSKDLQRCIQKMVAGQGKEVFSALQYCGGRTTDTYTPLSQDRVKSIKINIGRQVVWRPRHRFLDTFQYT